MMMWTWLLLIPIAFVVVIGGGIWLLAWLSRRSGSGESSLSLPSLNLGSQKSGREILEERYARGEIDREQYLEMLADLS